MSSIQHSRKLLWTYHTSPSAAVSARALVLMLRTYLALVLVPFLGRSGTEALVLHTGGLGPRGVVPIAVGPGPGGVVHLAVGPGPGGVVHLAVVPGGVGPTI